MVVNPPEHTRQRQTLRCTFGRNALHDHQAEIESLVTERLDALAGRLAHGEADFAEVVGEELPMATIGTWLNLPPTDYPLLRRFTHEQAYAQELFPTPTQLDRADTAAAWLRDYFSSLVADHRKHPRKGPISGWLRHWDAIEPDRNVVDEIVRRLATFAVMAGLETTSTLLSTAVWLLDQHQDQLRWLRENPREIPAAVDEILRYDPPVQLCSRVAARDSVVDDVLIPQGQLVYALLGCAHHDPGCTSDPERFDIRRRGRHLAFGGGVHYCVGSGLGKFETVLTLQALLRRFPTLRVTSAPEWEPRVAFRRIKRLLVSAP
jgi:cytochrome P450